MPSTTGTLSRWCWENAPPCSNCKSDLCDVCKTVCWSSLCFHRRCESCGASANRIARQRQHILSLNWDHVLSYVTIGWLRADSHVQLTKTTKNMVLFTPDILYRRNCFFLNLWNFANGPRWKRWHICCYFESDLCRQHKPFKAALRWECVGCCCNLPLPD